MQRGIYLIKKGNQYLTKKQDEYVWTKSYWMSNIFTREEAEQLIIKYDGQIVNRFEENDHLFKDFKPASRITFPNTYIINTKEV